MSAHNTYPGGIDNFFDTTRPDVVYACDVNAPVSEEAAVAAGFATRLIVVPDLLSVPDLAGKSNGDDPEGPRKVEADDPEVANEEEIPVHKGSEG